MSKTDDIKTGVPDEHGFAILFFVVGLVASLLFGWVIFPKLLYSEKPQPFDFNHRLHNELVGEGCESCHYFREDGSYAGTPKLAQCVECHADPMDVDEDEATFHSEYVAPNREVDWHVYSRQPDCVFFSHAAHVKAGEMECTTCHGDIGTSTSLKTYQENRITGYSRDIWGYNIAGFKTHTWDRMKMDDCAECHIANNVAQDSVQTGKGGCFKCHQ